MARRRAEIGAMISVLTFAERTWSTHPEASTFGQNLPILPETVLILHPMKRRMRSTITDVARVAGVAPMTVSRVLTGSARVQDKTAERVRKAVQLLRYEPNEVAREFRWGAANTFGLVVPNISDPSSMVYVREIYATAELRGQSVLLFLSDGSAEKERVLVHRAAQRGLRGLMLIPGTEPSLLTVSEIDTLPLVALHRPLTNISVDSVLPQDRQGARLGTQHLVEHRLRRILFVSYGLPSAVSRNRVEGYRDAMELAELRASVVEAATQEDMSQKVIAQLRSSPLLDIGVITQDASSTVAFLRVRQQMSSADRSRFKLVALEDFPTADLIDPSLTTIREPLQEMSILAVDLLLDRMSRREMTEQRRSLSVPMDLVVRSSCGCQGPGDPSLRKR